MEAASKKKQEKGPRVAVELPVEIQKKTFSLKAPTLKNLADYAAFLTAHHGRAIDEDRVMEGLIGELSRDRSFTTWQKEARHV